MRNTWDKCEHEKITEVGLSTNGLVHYLCRDCGFEWYDE